MIYYSGISVKHFQWLDIPDDTPRFASVDDCYRMFLGMHLRMMRFGREEVDPYYKRYLVCVAYFENRLKLSYQEFKNVVAVLVDLYQRYYRITNSKRRQSILDKIGKFERLIYLYTNKSLSSQTTHKVK